MILSCEGNDIEVVQKTTYLDIVIDDSLTFKPHEENLVEKLAVKPGFSFLNKWCIIFTVKAFFNLLEK